MELYQSKTHFLDHFLSLDGKWVIKNVQMVDNTKVLLIFLPAVCEEVAGFLSLPLCGE